MHICRKFTTKLKLSLDVRRPFTADEDEKFCAFSHFQLVGVLNNCTIPTGYLQWQLLIDS